MFPIDFDKERCKLLLECIEEGRDIVAPAGGWSLPEAMRLAGVLYFDVIAEGPPQYKGIEKYQAAAPEIKEAMAETLREDFKSAQQFYSVLTAMVWDDTYDSLYEEQVQALIQRSDDGTYTVQYVKGEK